MARLGLKQRLIQGAAAFVRGFFGGTRGGVAVWGGFIMVPLLGFVGLGVDGARGYMVKARLSQALDAAGLAAGKQFTNEAKAEEVARMVFKANYPDGYMDSALNGPNITFNTTAQTVTVTATAVLQTYFVHLVGVDTLTVGANTEVMRNGMNLEIALVLDVTGSMNNPSSKIADLKLAAKDLIDIVVYADQSEYYSKVAIVPYSNAVNVGSTYANTVRGPVPSWSITSATKTNPVVVTTSIAHGLNNGDKVFLSGVGGMTQINNNLSNSTNATTSPKNWVVANKTATTFQLRRNDGTNANGTSWGTYTIGTGVVDCMVDGCKYHRFTDGTGGTKYFQITTCVSERTGTEKYTDAAPSISKVGRVYPASNNPCIGSTIQPMQNDKATLKGYIDALTTAGSTAGHIGIAWGWYLLSPNWASLWPSASQPAAYNAPELAKIAVIMTDGAFNTGYCNGVIAQDSGTGSGNLSDHINCNATNGAPFTQALEMCTAMKAAGVTIFTVGFQIGSEAGAEDFMRACASSDWHFYNAADGGALKQAFRAIAVNISRLRLSK
jgi:Flp pilus assembly protein TadG